ncbi:MAG TPA: prepilin-type N-terminal cleavage/methylation domain-containing protein [Rudaea sp.]|nr:prepilin-type N-terminal cleavage/methylation domain-containing protein [Rudaea sp.]
MARRRSSIWAADNTAALDPPWSLVPGPWSLLSTGFSLIEILVVTVILAVVAATVTLAVAGAGGERQLARDADRVAALVGYACEQAELSGRDIGVSLNRAGYRFSRSEHADWQLLREGELRPRKWGANPLVTLTRDGNRVGVGDEFPDKPQLACFSSGELTAFRLELSLPDAAALYRVEATQNGEVVTSSVDGRGR